MDNAANPTPLNSCPSPEAFQQLQDELQHLRVQLEACEFRQRQILESMPQIVWFADAQGTKHTFNARWFDYTGLSAAEFVADWRNSQFLEVLHPDDRDRIQTQWQQAVNNGEKYEIEYRLRGADQSYRWFIEQAQPILGAAGQVLEWVGSCTDIHNRKQVEAALAEEQDFLQALLANLSEGIVACNAEGRLTLFNNATQEFHGLPAEPIPAEQWANYYNLYLPDGKTPMQVDQIPLFRALQGEQVRNVEMMIVPHQGTARTLLASGNAMINSRGDKLGAVVVMRDITERKQAEEALKKSEQKLSLHVQQTLMAVIEWSLDFRVVEWNPAAEEIFGYRRAEALGTVGLDLLVPDGARAVVSQVWQNLLLHKGGTRSTNENITQDGRVIVCEWYNTPLVDDTGQVMGVTSLVLDITERRQAEAAIQQLNRELEQRVQERTAQLEAANRAKDELLMRSQLAQAEAEAAEQRFRELVDGLTHAIVWERDARTLQFSFISQSATTILLYPVQSWMAHPDFWINVIRPEDQARVAAFYREEAVQGTEAEVEYGCLAADGRIVWVRDRVYSVRDSAGQVEKLRGLMVDVTAQKQAEEALKTRAEELTRTTAILTQTAAVLKKRNQELDQFAYVTSHDLKAPLRAIANLSQWIEEDLEDKLTPEMQRQMNLLRGRVHRMEALIDGILEYSRVGRTTIKAELVEVETLLQEVIDSLAPPADFAIAIASEMPILLTERTPLAQVFSNLIGNAIKHHNRLDGRITIAASDQGNCYEFVVIDDGPGICPRYHDKIFGIFQTLEARDKLESTGIGLALVKKIVESKGGTIRVESEEGRGARFYFTWPKQIPSLPLHWSL